MDSSSPPLMIGKQQRRWSLTQHRMIAAGEDVYNDNSKGSLGFCNGCSSVQVNESSFLNGDGSVTIHAGERLGDGIVTDSITTPVEKRHVSFEYGRYGNPTTEVLEEKISQLEGAESTLILASGMCASTVMMLALVPAGGHIITTTDCYRKTMIFIETFLPKMGITASVIDPADILGCKRAELLQTGSQKSSNEPSLNELELEPEPKKQARLVNEPEPEPELCLSSSSRLASLNELSVYIFFY
ncbi:putative cystathionine gamma-synthase [Helianthus annuus]|uniref:Cystathionine gamma-synthase n=1 Tax=Helianthus annuus TaxID=4232 RepID=A0A9K3GTC2_HELAN|nr:putative cystathionine gamma-synthase [Helianthus annuus]KAJ0811444.1 putative cystathionine gamma-synthase [Helianthus annuus]